MNAAGDQDLAADIWVKAQEDPAKHRAVFESLRQANFDILIGPHAGPVDRALSWIYSGAQAARSIAEDLKLIRPRPDDKLIEDFRKYKHLYRKS